MAANTRPGEANAAILEIGQPLIDELHVPRRDAERARQSLLAQRRQLNSIAHQNSQPIREDNRA